MVFIDFLKGQETYELAFSIARHDISVRLLLWVIQETKIGGAIHRAASSCGGDAFRDRRCELD